MPLTLSTPTPSPDGSPPFAPGRKLGLVEIAQLCQLLDEDPQCPSRVVLDKMAQRQIGASVSVHLLAHTLGSAISISPFHSMNDDGLEVDFVKPLSNIFNKLGGNARTVGEQVPVLLLWRGWS